MNSWIGMRQDSIGKLIELFRDPRMNKDIDCFRVTAQKKICYFQICGLTIICSFIRTHGKGMNQKRN